MCSSSGCGAIRRYTSRYETALRDAAASASWRPSPSSMESSWKGASTKRRNRGRTPDLRIRFLLQDRRPAATNGKRRACFTRWEVLVPVPGVSSTIGNPSVQAESLHRRFATVPFVSKMAEMLVRYLPRCLPRNCCLAPSRPGWSYGRSTHLLWSLCVRSPRRIAQRYQLARVSRSGAIRRERGRVLEKCDKGRRRLSLGTRLST